MDTGIGAGDGMGVKAGKTILGGGEVKAGKGVGVLVVTGIVVVGVSAAGGVIPHATKTATKMIQKYRWGVNFVVMKIS